MHISVSAYGVLHIWSIFRLTKTQLIQKAQKFDFSVRVNAPPHLITLEILYLRYASKSRVEINATRP